MFALIVKEMKTNVYKIQQKCHLRIENLNTVFQTSSPSEIPYDKMEVLI